jgi:hypothetical protein
VHLCRHIIAMSRLFESNQNLQLHGPILLAFSWKLVILKGLSNITRQVTQISFCHAWGCVCVCVHGEGFVYIMCASACTCGCACIVCLSDGKCMF